MIRAGRLLTLALVPTLAGGCSGDHPTGPQDAAGVAVLAASHRPAPASIDGMWNWTRTVQLTAPDWVAIGIFGIPPEGRITHFRCEGFGTLEIDQTGDTFAGTMHRENSICETNGGFDFELGEADILITEGEIRGRSVAFTLIEDNGMLMCPYHGVIADASNGTAAALRGTGRCIIPGHPSSPVPLDPPPAGTSKILDWQFWR